MATPSVNHSKLITSVSRKIHNSQVIEFMQNEWKLNPNESNYRGIKFPDVKSRQKALRDSVIIRSSDPPNMIANKVILFNFLINPFWNGLMIPSEEIKLRTNHLPLVEFYFMEDTKDQKKRSTFIKRLYFPDNELVSKLKRGKCPKLPVFNLGRISKVFESKAGTTMQLRCETTAECNKWGKIFEQMIDSKYRPFIGGESWQLSKETPKKKLYLRYAKYFPEGRENGAVYTGYPA